MRSASGRWYPIYRQRGSRREAESAHRVMWQLLNGPITRKHGVRQHCGDEFCVAPAHLVRFAMGARGLDQTPYITTLPPVMIRTARKLVEQRPNDQDLLDRVAEAFGLAPHHLRYWVQGARLRNAPALLGR